MTATPAACRYDHVVIACGRSVNLGSVPGMSDHAFALKNVGDAMALRAHVIEQLEDATFAEVLAIFANDHADTLYIVDDDRRIEGVLTRTDLMRAVDLISTLPILERNAASVQHFMSRDPMVLTLDDSPTAAAMMMRDRGLKTLPVVTTAEDPRVVGCVRTETMMHMVLQELTHLAQGA